MHAEQQFIPEDDLEIFSPTIYKDYEKLPPERQIREAYGVTASHNERGIPETTIFIKDKYLCDAVKTKYERLTQPRFNRALQHLEQERNYEGLDTIAALAEITQKAASLIETNDNTRAIFREYIKTHEDTHITQSYRFIDKDFANSYHYLQDSEYPGRLDFRQRLLQVQTLAEIQAYQSAFKIFKNPEIDPDTKQAVLTLTLLDKAAYPFVQEFQDAFENAKKGRVKGLEANIFGTLGLLLKDAELLEKVYRNEITIEEIQEKTLGALDQYFKTPEVFIKERTDDNFGFSVDRRIDINIEKTLAEVEELRNRGDLPLRKGYNRMDK